MAYSQKMGTAVPKFIVHGGFLGGLQLDASNVFSGLPTGSAALADGASAVTGTLNSTAFAGSQKTVISALNQLAYDDTVLTSDVSTNESSISEIVASDVTFTAGAGMATISDTIDMDKGEGQSVTIAVDGNLQDLDTLGVAAEDGQFIVATGAGAFAYESGATARTSLGLGGLATLDILDEDGMGSDSATRPPSQQSVKAYVDAQVDTADSLAEMSDVTLTTPGDAALLLYDTGTSTWRDAALSGDATISDTGVIAIAAGAVEGSMLDDNVISGQDALGSATVAQADLLMIDDGPGTVKKVTFSNFEDSIFENISSGATVAAGGALTLAATSVTNGMLAGSIADSKLDTIDTANKVDVGALDIDGASEMGAGLADADLFIVDDGGAGTEKSMLASRLPTYIGTKAYTQSGAITNSGIQTFNHEKLVMKDSAGTAYTLSIVGGILKIVS